MDQLGPQISVAPLANPEKLGPSASRVLSRRQSKLRRQIASLGEGGAVEYGRVDHADAMHGFEDYDVLSLKAVSRYGFGLANSRAELIELMLGLSQFTIDKAQTSDERAHVDTGRFSNATRNFEGRFSQSTDNGLSIDSADRSSLVPATLNRSRRAAPRRVLTLARR
jgi:hypothetical protein